MDNRIATGVGGTGVYSPARKKNDQGLPLPFVVFCHSSQVGICRQCLYEWANSPQTGLVLPGQATVVFLNEDGSESHRITG